MLYCFNGNQTLEEKKMTAVLIICGLVGLVGFYAAHKAGQAKAL